MTGTPTRSRRRSATGTSRACRAYNECASRGRVGGDLRRHRRRVRAPVRRHRPAGARARRSFRRRRLAPPSSRRVRRHRRRLDEAPTQREAAHALQDAGVSAAPVLNIPDLMADENLRARGFWETVSHAAAGTWDMEGVVAHVAHARPHPPPRRRCSASTTTGCSATCSAYRPTEIAALEAEGVTAREPNLSVPVRTTSTPVRRHCHRPILSRWSLDSVRETAETWPRPLARWQSPTTRPPNTGGFAVAQWYQGLSPSPCQRTTAVFIRRGHGRRRETPPRRSSCAAHGAIALTACRGS